MGEYDYCAPWYHGSPEELTVLRRGSWVTQFKEMAKAFSHKPTLISSEGSEFGGDCKHNGQQPGFLYAVSEPLTPSDVSYLGDTAQSHWRTQRDLQIRLVAELPIDDPPQLGAEEIAALRRKMPEGATAFIGPSDAELNETAEPRADDEDSVAQP